jgi:hypothetical protein
VVAASSLTNGAALRSEFIEEPFEVFSVAHCSFKRLLLWLSFKAKRVLLRPVLSVLNLLQLWLRDQVQRWAPATLQLPFKVRYFLELLLLSGMQLL